MVVRNDGKKRLTAERRKVLAVAVELGSAPSEASPPELLILVLESEVPGVKKQAFDRLFAAGCEDELSAIAKSDSVYARTAKAELARAKEPGSW